MPTRTHGWTSPLERLRRHLDEVDLTCDECGYEDRDGAWSATATGRRVEYVHECPSCAAVKTRTIRFPRRPTA